MLRDDTYESDLPKSFPFYRPYYNWGNDENAQ